MTRICHQTLRNYFKFKYLYLWQQWSRQNIFISKGKQLQLHLIVGVSLCSVAPPSKHLPFPESAAFQQPGFCLPLSCSSNTLDQKRLMLKKPCSIHLPPLIQDRVTVAAVLVGLPGLPSPQTHPQALLGGFQGQPSDIAPPVCLGSSSPAYTRKRSDLLTAMGTKLLLWSCRECTASSRKPQTPNSWSFFQRMPQGTWANAFS